MDWVQILTAEGSDKPAGYIVRFSTPFLAKTKSDGQVRIHIHEDFEQHLSELADTTVRVWSPRTPYRYAEYDFQDVVLTTDAVTHGFLVEIPATKTAQTNGQ
ncbi:hypothetical protein GCM10017044_09860 [Kordiimonas sediminis]|uniref:Uncharacterized protein n=1 Tax=Kordiimonas sediminis TaxID=1735581 RepID=A0A919ANS3_9PROT|nr:hypothetical protein [Kordiimonas sediminis]GHF17507.1 hypothetical protein GCM10017044_09860 [Kordiimonas sediminis]